MEIACPVAGCKESLSSLRRPASPHEIDVGKIGSGVLLAITSTLGKRKDVRSRRRTATRRAKLFAGSFGLAVLKR